GEQAQAHQEPERRAERDAYDLAVPRGHGLGGQRAEQQERYDEVERGQEAHCRKFRQTRYPASTSSARVRMFTPTRNARRSSGSTCTRCTSSECGAGRAVRGSSVIAARRVGARSTLVSAASGVSSIWSLRYQSPCSPPAALARVVWRVGAPPGDMHRACPGRPCACPDRRATRPNVEGGPGPAACPAPCG